MPLVTVFRTPLTAPSTLYYSYPQRKIIAEPFGRGLQRSNLAVGVSKLAAISPHLVGSIMYLSLDVLFGSSKAPSSPLLGLWGIPVTFIGAYRRPTRRHRIVILSRW